MRAFPFRWRQVVKLVGLLAFFALGTGSFSWAQDGFRVFTGASGDTIEAKLMAFDGQVVRFVTLDGKIRDGGIQFFSAKDQEHIRRWASENQAPVDYNFDIEVLPKMQDRRRADRGSVEVTSEDWIYLIEIRNASGVNLENIEVQYQIYKTNGRVDDRGLSRKANNSLLSSGKLLALLGKFELKELEMNREVELTTNAITVLDSDLNGGFYYTDGSDDKRADELIGVSLRILHNGVFVSEWSQDSSRMKRYNPAWVAPKGG
ncbi:MAG: hypothetical protein AAF555_11295 [Verrucomicrobiota bacterium]